MSENHEPFDAVKTRLIRGVNLIEAGAGTGKTYAIVMMVLRGLVELDLELKQMLVVTYTKAATEELKGRVRERLELVRELLKNPAEAGARCDDESLRQWLAGLADPVRALRAVYLALADIDTAQVFTIHGYCQRMLAELALESGQCFEVELVADIGEVVQELADDFWREVVYPLPPIACKLIVEACPTPETLLASVFKVLGGVENVEPAVLSFSDALRRFEASVDGLRAWVLADGGELEENIEKTESNGYFKKNGFKTLCDAIEFCKKNTLYLPSSLACLQREGLLDQLSGSSLRGAKKSGWIADWLLPEEGVAGVLAAGRDLLLAVRGGLALRLRAELVARLEARGAMGFDDLIGRLATAIRTDESGALRAKLAGKYCAALIDEFQDTDAAQYAIFFSVFGQGQHWLYLIGDPKQAIYSFRGADIYSYFRAKKAADRKLTLGVNFRSNQNLVEEVNRLFSSREKPFFYEEELLSYFPVQSVERSEEQCLGNDSESDASIIYCQLGQNLSNEKDDRWSSAAASACAVRFSVGEINRLLHGRCTVRDKDGPRPLLAKDIAILVRSHRQGEAVREELAAAKIPAVLRSKSSVFHSAECRELFLLLQAVERSTDPVRLKTALSISWFGLTGDDLAALWRNETMVGGWSDRFAAYNRLWREKGFMPMMSHLLESERVLVTVAGLHLAERRLTNIFQLIELVHHTESMEKLGIFQVLQWLRRRMDDEKAFANSELLMESDEEAVQIVTMHSAKGLEYHVVFCPFLWYAADNMKNESDQVVFHDENLSRKLDLGSPFFAERKARAGIEQRAEDLRLLYVAITRAKSRCYVVWADVRKHSPILESFASALGYLLFPMGQVDFAIQHDTLRRRAELHSGVAHWMIGAELELSVVGLDRPQVMLQPALPSGRSLYTAWQMSSFSALAGLSEYEYEAPGLRGQSGFGALELAAGSDLTIDIPGLPAGAHFGNAVHDLLEKIPFSQLAAPGNELLAAVRLSCRKYGVAAGDKAILQLLERVVTAPLLGLDDDSSAAPLRLADLHESKILKELEYYLHLDPIRTTQINEILADEPAVAPLTAKELRGYLTGFVDLIFECNNKYYLADYKTNYLGDKLAGYNREQLAAAMHAHNYGLQYWLYTVVLDRYLANKIDGYSYERDFGGVFYLFVRGMSPVRPGFGVYHAIPDCHKVRALAELLQETADAD